ncbi:MAG: ABC transporter permease [Acidimicrobiia bacterium]
MLKVTLKNLFARKFRLVLTSLAVVLGVAFMSGTFVLTDTLGQVFDDLFADVNRGVDVDVRSKPAFDEKAGGPGTQEVRPPLESPGGPTCTRDPGELLTTICGVDGVRVAEGSVQGYALVTKLDARGRPDEAIQPQGAPTIGVSWGPSKVVNQAFGGDGMPEVGRRPTGAGQVAIDESTADEAGLSDKAVERCSRGGSCKGARVQMVFLQHEPGIFDVVGTFRFGTVGNLAGATLAAFDISTAQEVMNRTGQFDEIRIAATDGVSQTELRGRVRDAVRALPDGRSYEALTGEQLAKDTSDQIRENLGFFNTFLLVFALIALFVGAFIIYNTFSIIVAQRARELGLLRALGASGGQVMGSVAIEALVVGLLSSVLGLAFGVVVAIGLEAAMKGLGFDLPSGAPVIATRTVIVSMVAGTLVTFVSALAPARRAARVAPMAALRSGATLPSSGRRRVAIGAAFTTVGITLVILGLTADVDSFPGGTAGCVGAGAALVFVGVAMLSPIIAVPVARFLGWLPARFRGMSGVLARENSTRNPRRTASTAAALMIGVAIVAVVAIFGASVKTTLSSVLENDYKAEFSLQSEGGFQPISPEAAVAVRDDDALQGSIVTEWRFGQFEVDGSTEALLGVNTNLNSTLNIDPSPGAIARWKAEGGFLLFADTYDELPAATRRAGVLPVRFPTMPPGETKDVPIVGTFATKDAINNDYLLAMRDYAPEYASTDLGDVFLSVKLPPGMSLAEGRTELDRVLEPFPGVKVQDQEEFKESQEAQIDQFLNLMYLLLALAVAIALLGIANTLALSVFERTHELGLLRAVGMGRSQLRRMIRYEAVIISVFGSLLGIVLGVAFGVAMVQALSSEGINLGLPVGQLVIFVVLAAFAGLVAGIWPARRAARLDVLDAISHE